MNATGCNLDAHWQNRIERACYEADRAQRQFDAVEPENRLVARTLERAWEAKLSDFEQLEREYARFKLEQPQQLTEAERKEISDLSENLPRLWNAEGTTDADRKEILRQVIEKVTVNVEGESEWVEVHVHWLGGQQTYSRIRRPIAGSTRLSRWPEMIQRLKILKDAGLSSREIAARLNEEGFKPAKGATITAEMVRTWSSRHGLTKSRRDQDVTLGPNEWTIPSIVERYQLSHGTIHGWIQRGQLAARQTGGRRGRWIIQADEQQLDQLVNNRRTRKKRKTPKIRNRVGGSTVTKTSR